MADVEDDCIKLKASLVRELTTISKDLEEKYGTMQPFLNLAAQGRLLIETMERALEDASTKISEISRKFEDIKSGVVEEKVTSTEEKWNSCTKALDFIGKLKSIEELLVMLRSTKGLPLDNALGLVQCKAKLAEISTAVQEVESEGYVIDSPVRFLTSEYAHQSFEHRYEYSSFYENFVWLPKANKSLTSGQEGAARGVSTLFINNADSSRTSQYLTAMNIVGQLQDRLKAWKTAILDIFCSTIISSCDGADVLDISVSNNRFTFKVSPIPHSSDKKMDVEKVLSTLETFFQSLSDALDGIEMLDASGCMFKKMVGADFKDELIVKVLKECIAIVVPVSCEGDKDQTHFLELVERGEKFVKLMIEWNFFAPNTSLIHDMEKDTIFIDRRCFAIVSKSKELILDDYTNLTVVGSDGESKSSFGMFDETLNRMKEFVSDDIMMSNSRNTHCPTIFKLMKCTVSTSIVEFTQLVWDTLKAAVEAKENEALRERLALTARNVVQLYIVLSPRQQGHKFTTVPHMAAIFYNNCHYLIHRLMTIALEVNKDLTRVLCEPLMSDLVPRLREVAADCMEATLTRSKRDLATLLDNPSVFEYLPKEYKLLNLVLESDRDQEMTDENKVETPHLVSVLSACLLHISSIAKVFKEVLTELVYCKSIAALISFMLSSVTSRMTSQCDIRENDARALVTVFGQLLLECDKLLFYRGRSRVPEFCGREYFRLQEVIFCLGGSLRDVETRWCNGKGPLAEWLTHEEVHRMIIAMFADSKLRQDVLNTI